MRPWTKDEREAYKDSTMHYNKYDLYAYIDDLIDTWHASMGLNVSLYSFLGFYKEEVSDWAGNNIIPYRIVIMWEEGEY